MRKNHPHLNSLRSFFFLKFPLRLHQLRSGHERRLLAGRLVCWSLLLTFGSQPFLGAPVSRNVISRPASRIATLACTAPTAEQAKAYRDAAAAARTVLEKMNPAKADAENINTALKTIKFDDNMVTQFERVAEILEAGVASRNGRFTPLRQAMTELTGKIADLNKAYIPFRPCEEDSTAAPEIKTVIEDFKSLGTTIQEQLKIADKLQEAIKNIPDKVQQFIGLIATKAQGAVPLAPTLAPQTLRSELARTLPDLARALRVRRQFAPITDRISKALDPAVVTEIKSFITQKPEFSFDSVDLRLMPALAKVRGWAEQAAQVAREQQVEVQEALARAMRDPFHQQSEALAAATVAESQRRDFTALANAFLELLTDMQREDVPASVLPPNFVPTQARELSNFTQVLQLMAARFARAVVQLSGDIPVDKSTWTMASVDLFYFDNVERLIRVLAPNARKIGGRADLQGAAETKRRELNEKSQLLEEREAEVSDSRQAVADLRERLRVATSKTRAATETQRAERATERRTAEAAEAREREMTQRRKNLDARKTLASNRATRAQTAVTNDPTDLERQRQLDLARQDLDRATLLADNAKADEERAHDEAVAARTEANKTTTDIDQEVQDLTEELGEAETDLETAEQTRKTATSNHRMALREAFLAAQVENFAFAQARDNVPFWTNLPEPRPTPANSGAETAATAASTSAGRFLDSDPVSHVLLFAFPDSRTIFIRGQRDDIDLVRQIIKEFDQPQGQAMMTLRTMEISSDGSKDSARRALKFLKGMDADLVSAQSKIEQALASLRDEINKQVKVAADDYEKPLKDEIDSLKNVGGDREKARRKKWLEFQLDRRSENETIAFYDPKVLQALGWRKEFPALTVDTNFLNAVIPPPSQSVNLAQALIILTLASSANRKEIVSKLSDHHFSSLKRFLGADGDAADVLGFQSKLVDALRFNGITHVLEVAEAKVRLRTQLIEELKPFDDKLDRLGKQLDLLDEEITNLTLKLEDIQSRLKNPRLSQSEIDRFKSRADEINKRSAEAKNEKKSIKVQKDEVFNARSGPDGSLFKLNRDLPVILSWLQGNTSGIAPELLLKRIEQSIERSDGTSGLLLQAVGLRRSARFRFSQASESAVNLTFRKYLEQVNRDLTEAFVKPTFRTLNERLLDEKLGVGVIQETSILASNRLVARVDPRGSAQLAVGEEKNVLEAAIQLTNLFGLAGKGLVTSAAGNPLALAGSSGGSSVLAGAQSVLGALDQLPRGAAPAVYGIATGNLFEVTPVIDPSGQALRFRFDLVSATQIREPNETIDPQLPRIERHSVNTEVQLGDHEIRLISQFQANSRLGIAKRKSGGVPILKDIPGISEVPLIGWFVKRGGRSAQTQQSFIFCQTTMYPTLSEVLDVAVRSPSFTGLD